MTHNQLTVRREGSLPDAAARLEIFKVHTRGKPLAADVDLAALASTASEGRSGADIELVCRKASLAAIRDFLAAASGCPATLDGFVIRNEHFRTAMCEVGTERCEKPGKDVAP